MNSSLGIHQHLEVSTMRQLLSKELPRSKAFLRVAHLHLCASCRTAFEEEFGEQASTFLAQLIPDVPPKSEAKQPHIAAAFAARHSYFREEAEAMTLLERMLETTDPEALVENPAFWKLGLVELILAHCRENWRHADEGITQRLKAALKILDKLSPDAYPKDLVTDAVASTQIFLARSYLGQRKYRDAWAALRTVELRDLENEEAAWLLTVRSCLHRDARKFDSAIQDSWRAIELFQRLGLSQEEAQARASLGLTLIEKGDIPAAARYLRNTLRQWERATEVPTTVLRTTLNNLAYASALLGNSFEAARLQREIRQRFAHFDADKPYLERRARWLDALIAQGLGQGAKARRIFRELRDEFLDAGVPYDAALVALDLAVVCLNEGRTGEAARLALESGPIFEAHGTSREGWMAFCILIQSLKAETATVAQVHEVIDQLRAHEAADLPET